MDNIFKRVRNNKGVTQKKCSEDTGISIRTLNRYENGKGTGDPKIIGILAAYYGVSMDELYGRMEKEK